MAVIRNGKREQLPYSLSRWTDLPAAKWDWFKTQLDRGYFIGFDPTTAIPAQWSLDPHHTFGLIFWTKNPKNLIADADTLKRFPLVVHMTLTGWSEVEKGAPSLQEGLDLMAEAVDTFGPHRVTWRCSPVPMTPDVVERFAKMAESVEKMGISDVYLAFLQENDLLPEGRPERVRREALFQMARTTKLQLLLCEEDSTLRDTSHLPFNLDYGVCESGLRFAATAREEHQSGKEGCGCSLAVDPFTINESCTMGCSYCYAADKSLAVKKHNTTRIHLPVV